MGGTGVGIYGSGWHDSGIRGGVFSVGSHYVCGKRGGVWMGAVGACGGRPGGVFIGICEYTAYSFRAAYGSWIAGNVCD